MPPASPLVLPGIGVSGALVLFRQRTMPSQLWPPTWGAGERYDKTEYTCFWAHCQAYTDWRTGNVRRRASVKGAWRVHEGGLGGHRPLGAAFNRQQADKRK